MSFIKIGDFLKRSKIAVDIEDLIEYNRVTIRINHNGVSLRDQEIGNKIGTKKQFILNAGQFIVSKIDARYGAFGIAPEEVDGAIITGNFWAYDVDFKRLNIEWFNQFTNSPDFYDLCERASSGITHRKYLNENSFLNHEIDLPNVEEQLRQIEKIKDQKISFAELSKELFHQLSLVKQLRQQFLQDAMQGKLVEQNSKDEPASELLKRIKVKKELLIKEKKLKSGKSTEQSVSLIEEIIIPKDWHWCKADEIFFITKLAGFEYTEHISLMKIGEIPVIRAQNVRPLNIEKTNLLFIDAKTSNILDRCSLVKKCLLVTFIGAGIGDVATFDEKERWHLAPNVAKMEPFDGCENLVNVKYLNYFLMSSLGQKEIFKHVKATAQPSLSMGTIRDIDFPIPPLSEQQRIVQKLDELFQYCNGLEESIKQSASHNEKLLQQVLREALRKEVD